MDIGDAIPDLQESVILKPMWHSIIIFLRWELKNEIEDWAQGRMSSVGGQRGWQLVHVCAIRRLEEGVTFEGKHQSLMVPERKCSLLGTLWGTVNKDWHSYMERDIGTETEKEDQWQLEMNEKFHPLGEKRLWFWSKGLGFWGDCLHQGLDSGVTERFPQGNGTWEHTVLTGVALRQQCWELSWISPQQSGRSKDHGICWQIQCSLCPLPQELREDP